MAQTNNRAKKLLRHILLIGLVFSLSVAMSSHAHAQGERPRGPGQSEQSGTSGQSDQPGPPGSSTNQGQKPKWKVKLDQGASIKRGRKLVATTVSGAPPEFRIPDLCPAIFASGTSETERIWAVSPAGMQVLDPPYGSLTSVQMKEPPLVEYNPVHGAADIAVQLCRGKLNSGTHVSLSGPDGFYTVLEQLHSYEFSSDVEDLVTGVKYYYVYEFSLVDHSGRYELTIAEGSDTFVYEFMYSASDLIPFTLQNPETHEVEQFYFPSETIDVVIERLMAGEGVLLQLFQANNPPGHAVEYDLIAEDEFWPEIVDAHSQITVSLDLADLPHGEYIVTADRLLLGSKVHVVPEDVEPLTEAPAIASKSETSNDEGQTRFEEPLWTDNLSDVIYDQESGKSTYYQTFVVGDTLNLVPYASETISVSVPGGLSSDVIWIQTQPGLPINVDVRQLGSEATPEVSIYIVRPSAQFQHPDIAETHQFERSVPERGILGFVLEDIAGGNRSRSYELTITVGSVLFTSALRLSNAEDGPSPSRAH